MTSSEDICQMMGWDQQPAKIQAQQKLFLELGGPEKEIFDLLGRTGTAGIDEIYLNTGISASKVAAILLKLEFDGLISSLPGKVYRVNR